MITLWQNDDWRLVANNGYVWINCTRPAAGQTVAPYLHEADVILDDDDADRAWELAKAGDQDALGAFVKERLPPQPAADALVREVVRDVLSDPVPEGWLDEHGNITATALAEAERLRKKPT